MTDYKALNGMVRRHKSALTRAKNSGDHRKVIVAVAAAYDDFDAGLWPDSWHTWNIAYQDARWQLDSQGWDPTHPDDRPALIAARAIEDRAL